jgi:hypothetical protein
VKDLKDEDFKITKEFYNNNEDFLLMKRKGIYPYEFMDSFKEYDQTRFPSKECFDDKLNNKKCTVEDYEYAKLVYKKTECKNLGDYTEIYMMNDVLLLADMFESFREICNKSYGIDTCWCYGTPGLA